MTSKVALKTGFDSSAFPAIANPHGEGCADYRLLSDYIRDKRGEIEDLLANRGAILFRGFNVRSTQEFESVFRPFNSHAHARYAGVSPRTPLSQVVHTSTDAPPGFRIVLHQERAYLREYPRKLAFFCRVAADIGGETTLCDMRRLTSALPRQLFVKARDRGVRYTRSFAHPAAMSCPGLSRALSAYRRTWAEVFASTSEAQIETVCKLLEMDYQWLPNGSLRTVYHAPGAVSQSDGEQPVWFNQIATLHPNPISLGPVFSIYEKLISGRVDLPHVVEWGDGTPITFDEIRPLYAALDRVQSAVRWEAGDVLLLDNILVAHGRNSFRGKRDVQVMMFD